MSHHAECKARSYAKLNEAQQQAKEKSMYDFAQRRVKTIQWVREQFNGREPHPWQLDVGEAIALGLDALVISLTGSGKSLPFVILLACNRIKK